MSAETIFPIKLYVYRPDGKWDSKDVLTINSPAELHSERVALAVRVAVKSGVKVIMADCFDFCVFHAEGGKVLHPKPEEGQ